MIDFTDCASDPLFHADSQLSKAVRERIWAVMTDSHAATGEGSIVMVWRDDKAPGGLGIASLGAPPRQLTNLAGVLVSVW